MSCSACSIARSRSLAFCPDCGLPTGGEAQGAATATGEATPESLQPPLPPPPSPTPTPAQGWHRASRAPDGPYTFLAALLLAVLPFFMVGLGGIHRMYTGKVGTGILQLLTGGGLFVWQLIDIIMIASGSYRDGYGCRLRRT